MVIGKPKNFAYFDDGCFSFFNGFIVKFKQIVRVKPLGYALIIYIAFVINPCVSHSFYESPRQNLLKSSNSHFLFTEIQNKSFSDIGFFVEPLCIKVEDHFNFIERPSEFWDSLNKKLFGASDFLKQVIGIGGSQNSQDSDNNLIHSFLLGALFYVIFHLLFVRKDEA